jgi:type I restriction enzyme S subunit
MRSGFPKINREELGEFSAYFPPIEEQRRIADIHDAADDAIRQTERLITKLRQVKTGLLHDLLTRGIDEQERLRDPVAHPEQFKDSPVGRIPEE